MPRGYMEGPAAEEAERRADEVARRTNDSARKPLYPAVYGSHRRRRRPHFLGWLTDVDPDKLFASGQGVGRDRAPRRGRELAVVARGRWFIQTSLKAERYQKQLNTKKTTR